MKNLFEQSRSHWVRYDRYELKTAADGKRYITPGKNAKPDIYNPLKEAPGIVLDALNVGMLMMSRSPEDEVQKAILEFVIHYGLLGLMTALPTTPSFMDYEAVYLPKNHFIKAESMETEDYLALFYPFDQLDLVKKGIESSWSVSGDNMMVALTMTFASEPMAKTMSFQREYAEAYDWVAQQFKDWAFTLTTSVLYYNDYDSIDEDTRNLYRKAMAAFGGIAPSYHIELLDKPGQLKDVSRIIADLGGNVISIHHERANEGSDINGCFLRITMETRDYAHIQEIRSALMEAGFHLVD